MTSATASAPRAQANDAQVLCGRRALRRLTYRFLSQITVVRIKTCRSNKTSAALESTGAKVTSPIGNSVYSVRMISGSQCMKKGDRSRPKGPQLYLYSCSVYRTR